MSTTARLASDSKLTWIDEATADSMFHRLGSHHLAIVEFKVAKREEKDGDDEDQAVVLKVTNISLATPGKLEDHLRELQRAEYMRRKHGNQLPLDSDEEDSDEIIRRGRNVLLLCDTCLHKQADERINHTPTPDADGAECTWKDSGEPVEPGDDDQEPADKLLNDIFSGHENCRGKGCDNPAHDQETDEPWPGDPDYQPEPDLTPTLGDPFTKA